MSEAVYKLLIIEDDIKLRETIADYLTESGFTCYTAQSGEEGLEIFNKNKVIDLILLDGMLPKMDGFDVLKQIRETSNIPVIITSARETEADQLKGFNLGADNYLTKPFMLSVLKQHIIKLIRRCVGEIETINKGELSVDCGSRKVYLQGAEMECTPKEYDVLCYLISNENKVLSRDMILNAVWGEDYFGDLRTVDTIIKQLRKKLGDEFPYIKSIYGVGYSFEV